MTGQPMGPDCYGAEELMAHLGNVQLRARQTMRDFKIASDHITVMARQAELLIPDPARRAEFLHMLIDLHEFGREARRRGLLDRSKPGPDRPAPDRAVERPSDTRLFASPESASDEVSADASRALFAFLDR